MTFGILKHFSLIWPKRKPSPPVHPRLPSYPLGLSKPQVEALRRLVLLPEWAVYLEALEAEAQQVARLVLKGDLDEKDYYRFASQVTGMQTAADLPQRIVDKTRQELA